MCLSGLSCGRLCLYTPSSLAACVYPGFSCGCGPDGCTGFYRCLCLYSIYSGLSCGCGSDGYTEFYRCLCLYRILLRLWPSRVHRVSELCLPFRMLLRRETGLGAGELPGRPEGPPSSPSPGRSEGPPHPSPSPRKPEGPPLHLHQGGQKVPPRSLPQGVQKRILKAF